MRMPFLPISRYTEMFIYVGCGDGEGLRVYQANNAYTSWQTVQHLPMEDPLVRFVPYANKKMLYCLHAVRPLVSAFAIDPHTGKLRLVNRVNAGGLHPAGAALSRDGGFLLVAHADSPHLGIIPLAADGALCPAKPTITLPGQARALDVTMAPNGRFAIITDAGENKLCVLRFDPTSGLANQHQVIRARPVDAPHRAVFHPTMPLLYVSNKGNSTVTAYHWNAIEGRISFAQSIRTIPSDWNNINIAADITISPDGRYLYLANLGHDSIVIFAIQPGRGKLFMRAREAPGHTPHGLAWSTDGTNFLVANRDGNSIARYGVILANGMLTRQEPNISVPQPTAIAWID